MGVPYGSAAGTGLVLRLAAIGGAVATAIVVATAALSMGDAHRGVALIALPLLIGVAVTAVLAYPALVPASAAAVGLMIAGIGSGGFVPLSHNAGWARGLHIAAAGAALRAPPTPVVV